MDCIIIVHQMAVNCYGDMSKGPGLNGGNGLPEKSDENEKTVIELVHLICLKASSCSLMRS